MNLILSNNGECMTFLDEAKKNLKERMSKAFEVFTKEIGGIRAGKATTSLLSGLFVETEVGSQHINSVASINVLDKKTLKIELNNKLAKVSDIAKAIEATNLGTVQTGPSIVTLVLPDLTQETRKKYCKLLDEYSENAKISVRNIRRDAIEKYQSMQKKKELSEDDLRNVKSEIQKITDDIIKKIDDALAIKKEEVMSF